MGQGQLPHPPPMIFEFSFRAGAAVARHVALPEQIHVRRA